MKTLCFSADPILSSGDLEVIVSLLRGGAIAAIPTETVYGLAADLYQEKAVEEIFRVKGRPSDNPLIAHVSSLAQAEALFEPLPEIFYRLVDFFWPGPLTLIAKKRLSLPSFIAAGLSTIAVRMPSHVAARQIIEAVGSPLAAPSANISGRPSPTSVEDVLEDFLGLIPAIVDGGICSHGIESTVISLLDDKVTLLRPGAISREAIETATGIRVFDSPREGPLLSPGMKYRHYAPKARVHLVRSLNEIPGAYTPSINAQNLYAELRKADRLGHSDIAILLTPSIYLDEALMNRLEKASN